MKPIRKLAMVANREKAGALDLAHELEAIAISCEVEHPLTFEFPIPEGFLRFGGRLLCDRRRRHPAQRGPGIGSETGTSDRSESRQSRFPHDAFCASRQGPDSVRILGGAYRVVQRCTARGFFRPGPEVVALNDVLIKDVINSRIVHLEVQADGELVTDYYLRRIDLFDPDRINCLQPFGGWTPDPSGFIGHRHDTDLPAYPEQSVDHLPGERRRCRVTNCLPNPNLLVALDGQSNLMTSRSFPVRNPAV